MVRVSPPVVKIHTPFQELRLKQILLELLVPKVLISLQVQQIIFPARKKQMFMEVKFLVVALLI